MIVAADQWTKWLVVEKIPLYSHVKAIPGLFYLTYVQNTGAAFSSFDGMQWLFVLVFVVLGGMGNILGSVLSATVLYILPESLRGLDDYRMILYAIVLILVMLGTWSPKAKDLIAMAGDKIKSLFRRKGAGTNE